MWNQSWITQAEGKTKMYLSDTWRLLLFVGNIGVSGSAITHMAKIKDA